MNASFPRRPTMTRVQGIEPTEQGLLGIWTASPTATDKLFTARLSKMIDMGHPLALLATRMPWAEIEASMAPILAHYDRQGHSMESPDQFEVTTELTGGSVSLRDRPQLPVRLIVSLLYLKHAFNESDESLVERWSENVVWQFFSGMEYYQPRLPCDAMHIGRFRRVLGEAGVEQLLKSMIEAAVTNSKSPTKAVVD